MQDKTRNIRVAYSSQKKTNISTVNASI